MSSDNVRRVEIGKEDSSGGFWETLTSRFTQNVETRSRLPSFGVRRSGIDRVKPAKRLDEFRKIPETTPIVRKALHDFASDVVSPGYRIDTDDDTVKEYLEDEWCPQAAIIGGEKHNDLLPLLRLFIIERWRGGDALAEHVRSDPDNENSPITGLHLLNPEEIEFVTYENKAILVDPDPVDDVDAPTTRRGESAAYIQYGDGAIISRDRDATPLSQNDVTRSVLDPGAGKIRGTPVTETIAEDVAGFKNILRDKEEAIATKAYGLWQIAFGRDTLEYTERNSSGEETEVTEIIEWSKEDQDQYVEEHLEDIEPGAILTTDGEIDMQRLDGEVPDLIDDLEFYISNITSPLPTPKFIVGFESNINQFVTEAQDERYQRLIDEERHELERVFTDLMERIVERNLVDHPHTDMSVSEVPDDLKFKLEPAESESPVLSLSTEEIENMNAWAQAFDRIRGDMPVEMFADPASLRKHILQLPEDADPEEVEQELDEADPDLQQAADEMGIAITDITDDELDDDNDQLPMLESDD
jgi:hypothetical protein